MPITKWTLSKWPKFFNGVSKGRNFVQCGHTVPIGKPSVLLFLDNLQSFALFNSSKCFVWKCTKSGLFLYFLSLHNAKTDIGDQCEYVTINDQSVVGLELGTWTRGGRMKGADESNELWRHPNPSKYLDSKTFSVTSTGNVSVTRWLDYLFNIWPFAAMKIFPMAEMNPQNCQTLLEFRQSVKILPNLVTTDAGLSKILFSNPSWWLVC